MGNELKFYDIHFHTMDLSHANLTAFIERFESDLKSGINPLALIKIIFSRIKAKLLNDKTTNYGNVRNLLTYMESSIEYNYHILEYFLKTKESVLNNDEYDIGSTKYNKIVLCPLIMDFGNKNIKDKDAFYDIPPIKPIVEQIKDLLSAIKNYFDYELAVEDENNTFNFNIAKTKKEDRLFEIYPFMGINTNNYSKDEIANMIKKYFSEFKREDSIEQRKKRLFNAMGEFKGDLEDNRNCKNIFAGIKLYPPLGFEPWPTDDNDGMEKVKILYKLCIEHNIPLTTHCSMGGFKTAKLWKSLTDPGNQWKEVLKNQKHRGLKINFAHFGNGNKNWKTAIIEYMKNEEYNIYTDFSCNTGNHRYYREINRLIKNEKKIAEKILFGSDFMINLLYYRSYNEFLQIYRDTNKISNELKMKFANDNAERFLFAPVE